ncbi:hypothetical protein OIU34_23475 [Pararhizobium sp. BT-229]|uniref:hypothetical protein n=1 Tax=Pararhizobium sp. BT-229 TaxID=2986923 RepID=UPI0021F78260|nr:hypothetical protein [Pararhizobium sp. BT-229]MCV9964858.1 hypothetical protein [Pararhizobium sp. BT-229]
MLFSVPVHFNLTATRIGGERKQSTQAWSLVEFDMPDMADEDVPVVLEWKQNFQEVTFPASSVQNAIGPSPSDKPMHVRRFGETFLRPVMRVRNINAVRVSRHGEDAEFLTGQSVAEMLTRFEDVGVFATTVPGETFQRRLRKNGGNGLADFASASVDHDDLDRKVAAIRDRLATFMLVDGVFYERCPEPTVSVFTTEIEDGCHVRDMGTFALVTTDPLLIGRIDKRCEYYQVEDYESARLKAKHANSKRRHRDLVTRVNEDMAPVIDQMESIYAADTAWMRQVNRRALAIARWVGTQTVSSISDELFGAYSKLHKTMHTVEAEARFDTMGEAFAAITAACNDNATVHLAKLANEALEILDARPVSINVPQTRIPGL